jgi:hypothetical protein
LRAQPPYEHAAANSLSVSPPQKISLTALHARYLPRSAATSTRATRSCFEVLQPSRWQTACCSRYTSHCCSHCVRTQIPRTPIKPVVAAGAAPAALACAPSPPPPAASSCSRPTAACSLLLLLPALGLGS